MLTVRGSLGGFWFSHKSIHESFIYYPICCIILWFSTISLFPFCMRYWHLLHPISVAWKCNVYPMKDLAVITRMLFKEDYFCTLKFERNLWLTEHILCSCKSCCFPLQTCLSLCKDESSLSVIYPWSMDFFFFFKVIFKSVQAFQVGIVRSVWLPIISLSAFTFMWTAAITYMLSKYQYVSKYDAF